MLSGIYIIKVSDEQTVKSADVHAPDVQGSGGLYRQKVTSQPKGVCG